MRGSRTLPEMHQDNPEFKIDRNGQWFHDGAPIARHALAKLFSDRALKMDVDGQYWLQTPFEKYPVEVEDVPYIITDYEERGGAFIFTTNMAERVEVNDAHPIELREYKGDMLPYICVRENLYARLGRQMYYHLVHGYGDEIVSHGKIYKLGMV